MADGNASRKWGVLANRSLWAAVLALLLVATAVRFVARWLIPAEHGPPAPSSADRWDYPLPDIPPNTTAQYRSLMEQTRAMVVAVLDAHPDQADSIAALALLHYLCHNRLGEVACWQRCLELVPAHEMAYARLVACYEEKVEYQRIVDMMRLAVAADPDNVSFNGYLGSALMYLNRQDEARLVLEGLHKKVAGNAETHLVLGKVYEQLGMFEDAQRSLEISFALDSARIDVWYSLATACGRVGEKERAARFLERFQELKKDQLRQEATTGRTDNNDARFLPPRVAEILCYAGKACWYGGNVGRAEAYFLKAAEVCPENTESREFLSELCQRQGDLETALRWILELKTIEPDNRIHYRNEGILYGRLGRLAEAENVFRDICALEPQRGFGYLAMAELSLRAARNSQAARALATHAVEVEPTAFNYSILANICARSGDQPAAVRAIEQALRIDPDNPRLRRLQHVIRGNP
ncbi:MAG: tetratricopeptide repeat protein [Thermoguttaceae bacterium]